MIPTPEQRAEWRRKAPLDIDCEVTIPNAHAVEYDPATDRYLVHSAAFYGGAWVAAENMTPKETDR